MVINNCFSWIVFVIVLMAIGIVVELGNVLVINFQNVFFIWLNNISLVLQ